MGTCASYVLREIFPPTHGGSGHWLWEVATQLDPSNVTVVMHQHSKTEQFDRTHNLNIRRILLQSPEWGVRGRKGLRFYWQTLRFVRRTIQEKGSPKDTMIHCARRISESFVGYLMYRLYRTPYLCYVHGEDTETPKKSRKLAWIVKRSLKSAQVLICKSQNTATLLKQKWSAPEHKIRVIHPGVDTDHFTPAAYCQQTRERLVWGDDNVIKA